MKRISKKFLASFTSITMIIILFLGINISGEVKADEQTVALTNWSFLQGGQYDPQIYGNEGIINSVTLNDTNESITEWVKSGKNSIEQTKTAELLSTGFAIDIANTGWDARWDTTPIRINPWAIQAMMENVPIKSGHTYTVSFKAHATEKKYCYVAFGCDVENTVPYGEGVVEGDKQIITLGTEEKSFTYTFTNRVSATKLTTNFLLGAFYSQYDYDGNDISDIITEVETSWKGTVYISDFSIVDKGAKTYNVTFKDGNNIVSTQEVVEYTSATAPKLEKEGYTLSWDKEFDKITGNLTVNAVWTIREYNVVFKDGNEVKDTQTVKYGSAVQAPVLEKEGYILNWDLSFDNVTSDMIVNAIWIPNKYNVVFKDGDKIINTQTVEYGTAAVAPVLEKEGYTLSWDKSYDNVKEELEVNAVWSVNKYNVVFKDGDNVIKTQEVYYGYSATAPEISKNGYSLSWNKEFDRIIGDLTVVAVWIPKTVETTVNGDKKEETTTSGNQEEEITTKRQISTTGVKVGKTKVSKASKVKLAKKIKISFKKVKGASKYQIQISNSKKFKKVLVNKNVKKVPVSISSKKIKKQKKLYVRVRGVIVKDGQTYYGDWSNVKKVKIK